jgi:Mu transposase, C-terminal domain
MAQQRAGSADQRSGPLMSADDPGCALASMVPPVQRTARWRPRPLPLPEGLRGIRATSQWQADRDWGSTAGQPLTRPANHRPLCCESIGHPRGRPPGRYADPGQPGGAERPAWPTVGALAAAEALMPLPAVPYPATIEVTRAADDRASVAFRGNRYSVTPGLGGAELTLRHRLGTGTVEIFTPGGTLMVTHRLAPPGAGAMVRTPAHRAALEAVVLSQFPAARPCDRKANRPPGQAALTERAALMGAEGLEPSVDLDQLAEVVRLAFPPAAPATAVPGAGVTA